MPARHAQTRLDKALAEVKREVDIYGRETRQTEGPRPKPLDLESFASERGLTTGKTQMVDAREAQQYELGRSFEQVEFAWPPQRQEFAQVAYQDGIELYRPEQIQGENRDIYFLYWRVGQRDPYVPELAEIRDKVVDVWKQREALTIAKAEAATSGRQGRQSGRIAEGRAGRPHGPDGPRNERIQLALHRFHSGRHGSARIELR